MKSKLLFLIAIAGSSAIYAQSNPLSSAVKQSYNNIKNSLLKGAEKMSDADYAFKPAPESRTYGAVVTHIAAVQGLICASAKGDDKKFDDSKTGKADAVALLKAAFDYCDPIYDALTDANGLEMGKMFGRDNAKFNILNFGVIHDNEMYGTMAQWCGDDGGRAEARREGATGDDQHARHGRSKGGRTGHRPGTNGLAGGHQDARHQWRRLHQRQCRAPVREPHAPLQIGRAHV